LTLISSKQHFEVMNRKSTHTHNDIIIDTILKL